MLGLRADGDQDATAFVAFVADKQPNPVASASLAASAMADDRI